MAMEMSIISDLQRECGWAENYIPGSELKSSLKLMYPQGPGFEAD